MSPQALMGGWVFIKLKWMEPAYHMSDYILYCVLLWWAKCAKTSLRLTAHYSSLHSGIWGTSRPPLLSTANLLSERSVWCPLEESQCKVSRGVKVPLRLLLNKVVLTVGLQVTCNRGERRDIHREEEPFWSARVNWGELCFSQEGMGKTRGKRGRGQVFCPAV